MKRYLRNGFIQAALITFGFLVPDIVAGQPLTVGRFVVGAAIVSIAAVFAFCGIRAVRRMSPADEPQRS
jgi:hypothetical protein